MKKEEAIKEFEGACRKLLWGKYMAEQKLMYISEITGQYDIIARADRNFEKTIEKLDKDYMDVLEKVQKAGLSPEEIDEIKERISDEVEDIEWEIKFGHRPYRKT